MHDFQALELYLPSQPGIAFNCHPIMQQPCKCPLHFFCWQYPGKSRLALRCLAVCFLFVLSFPSQASDLADSALPLTGDTITFRDTVCFSNSTYDPPHPEWNGGSLPRVNNVYYNLNNAGNVIRIFLTVLPLPAAPTKPVAAISRLFCLGQTSTLSTIGNTSQFLWTIIPAGIASIAAPQQNNNISLQWTSDSSYTGPVKIVAKGFNACGISLPSDTLYGWLLNPPNPNLPAPRSSDSSICIATARSVVRTSFPSSQLLWGISPINAGGISNPGADSTRINWNPNFTGDAFVFYNSNTPCGFKKSVRLKIRVRPKAASSILNLDSVYCQRPGAIVNLEGFPEGGSFFINNNPAMSLPVSQAGLFQIRYRPPGCYNESSRQVRVQAKTAAQITGLDTLRCQGQPPQPLTGLPPNGIFEVNGTPQTVLATPDSGIYRVSYRAFCTDTATVRVRAKPLPEPQILFPGEGFCVDTIPANIQLQPPGGSLRVDGVPRSSFIPSAAGMHELIYRISIGTCTASDTQFVQVDAKPNLIINLGNPLQTTFCRSDTLINVFGWPEGGTFSPPLASGNGFNPALLPAGPNKISYLGKNGTCLDSVSISIKILDKPEINTSQIPADTLCQYGTAISLSGVSPPGGFWSGPGVDNIFFRPLKAGLNELSYRVPAIQGTSCAASAGLMIFVRAAPPETLAGDTSLCRNQEIFWSVPPGDYQLRWQDSSSSNSFRITEPGNFFFRAVKSGCTWYSDTLRVNSVRELPVFSLGKSRDECFRDPVRITGPAGMQSYRWEMNGEVLSEDSVCLLETPGTLVLEVSDRYSCRFKNQVFVRKAECPEIYVPEAFSPNGDGVNEVWKVFGRNISNLNVSVFNSWGEVVFYGTGKEAFWDGRFKGTDCPPGMYQFSLIYSGVSDQKGPFNERLSGQVHLVR